MSQQPMIEREQLLRTIEKLRARTGHLHQEVLNLQESASFDPRLPGLEVRAGGIGAESRALSDEAEQLRERLHELRRR